MILGIDPGLHGGFAVVDDTDATVIVEPMPLNVEGKIDLAELHRLLAHYAPMVAEAFIEKSQPMPGRGRAEGSVSLFTAGRGYGVLIGLLVALGVRFTEVAPITWSKQYAHGIKERDPDKRRRLIKEARKELVAVLYPGINLRKSVRSTTAHEGMVDALLIADYGMRLRNQTKQLELGEEPEE